MNEQDTKIQELKETLGCLTNLYTLKDKEMNKQHLISVIKKSSRLITESMIKREMESSKSRLDGLAKDECFRVINDEMTEALNKGNYGYFNMVILEIHQITDMELRSFVKDIIFKHIETIRKNIKGNSINHSILNLASLGHKIDPVNYFGTKELISQLTQKEIDDFEFRGSKMYESSAENPKNIDPKEMNCWLSDFAGLFAFERPGFEIVNLLKIYDFLEISFLNFWIAHLKQNAMEASKDSFLKLLNIIDSRASSIMRFHIVNEIKTIVESSGIFPEL